MTEIKSDSSIRNEAAIERAARYGGVRSRENGIVSSSFNAGYNLCVEKGELVSTIKSEQLNVTMTCSTTSKKLWYDTGSKQWVVAKLNRSGKVKSQTNYDESFMSDALADLRKED